MSTNTPAQLTSTLILALTQAESQSRTIQNQAARIERLIRENERLRQSAEQGKGNGDASLNQELEQTRRDLQIANQRIGELHNHEHENASLRQEIQKLKQPDQQRHESSQALDDLFQKQVEAQAEIYKLRKKLKRYKEKANGRLSVPISSPRSVFSTPELRSPRRVQNASTTAQEPILVTSSPPSRKRQRTEPEPLRETSVNTAHSRVSSTASKRGLDKKIAAIPLLTEDGDEHVPADQQPQQVVPPTLSRNGSWHGRLNGLLDARTPDRAPLHRPGSRAASDTARSPRKQFAISNMQHDLNEGPAVNAASTSARTTNSRRAPQSTTTSNAAMVSNTRKKQQSFRDSTPLRQRPLEELFIHDFKPSPRWMIDHQMSIGEYMHGRNGERLRAIAATLPHMPGPRVTDDELLIWFMGPGNDAKIANLTSVARKNLLAEAKIKRVAEKFGRVRVDYDKDNNPPGMWNIDFPGTQEEEANKRKAQEKERAEIMERYAEAKSGHGKWIFADEHDAI